MNKTSSSGLLLRALGLLILLVILLVLVLQGERPSQIGSQPTGAPPLAVAPEVCASSASPTPPNDEAIIWPDQLVAGDIVKSGPFTFHLWLYCDPDFSPQAYDSVLYSAITGLGIFTAWSYNGAELEGVTVELIGFEPELIPMSEFSGNLSPGTGSQFSNGIRLPDEVSLSSTDETSFRFVYQVRPPDGMAYGASLSFTLQSSPAGYAPRNVQITALPPEQIAQEMRTPTSIPTALTEYAPPTVQGSLPPDDFDPSASALEMEIFMGDDLDNPSFFYGDLYGDGYLLGRVNFGLVPGGWCDRSADGSRIAFKFIEILDEVERAALQWLDLRSVDQVIAPLPDLNIRSLIAWSPSGYRIAFFACASGQDCGLYILDTDSGQARQVTEALMGYHTLYWKPDGTQMLFYGAVPGSEDHLLYVLDLDTAEVLYSQPWETALNDPQAPFADWDITFPEEDTNSFSGCGTIR